MNKAIELLEKINTSKLRDLATWIDIKFMDNPNKQVQTDLREWADNIDHAIALLQQRPEAGDYEKRTIENTEVCTCGNIFVQDDDYDTLGSEGPVCCPDCGNEKFQTVKELLDALDAERAVNDELLSACRVAKMQILGMGNDPEVIAVIKKIDAAIAKADK